MGLDRLHQLTNSNDYKLKITLTDFDSKQYVAVYEDFKATKSFLSAVLLLKHLVRAKVEETTSKCSCPNFVYAGYLTKGRVRLPNRMNFRKGAKGGLGVIFKPKNYTADFGPL